jgi:hypothetical protein
MDPAQYAASTVDFWVLNARGVEGDAERARKAEAGGQSSLSGRLNIDVLKDKITKRTSESLSNNRRLFFWSWQPEPARPALASPWSMVSCVPDMCNVSFSSWIASPLGGRALGAFKEHISDEPRWLKPEKRSSLQITLKYVPFRGGRTFLALPIEEVLR